MAMGLSYRLSSQSATLPMTISRPDIDRDDVRALIDPHQLLLRAAQPRERRLGGFWRDPVVVMRLDKQDRSPNYWFRGLRQNHRRDAARRAAVGSTAPYARFRSASTGSVIDRTPASHHVAQTPTPSTGADIAISANQRGIAKYGAISTNAGRSPATRRQDRRQCAAHRDTEHHGMIALGLQTANTLRGPPASQSAGAVFERTLL